MNEDVSKAVGHYSSLFTLPSHRKIVVLLFSLCLLVGVFFPLKTGLLGLSFGIILFFITMSTDFAVFKIWMKNDPIFNFRRCSAISFFSYLIWSIFIFMGNIIFYFFRRMISIWVNLYILGFCVALILRLMVFSTVSFTDRGSIVFSTFLQPTFCNIILILGEYSFTTRNLLFLLLSSSIALSIISLFIRLLNRVGEKQIGISSLILFKAFLANWIADLNVPLESLFERFGHEHEIKLSLMAFRSNKTIKASIVVPAFHPGPFKNVGSSALPYMIQKKLEDKLKCITAVPHGLSGHELDLTSQLQNQKVIRSILNSLEFSTFNSYATPLVRVDIKEAKASCQIFGDCAFITLTTSPRTMEDLPRELDLEITEKARQKGLNSAIIVDTHNSIIEDAFNHKTSPFLSEAAIRGLEETLLQKRFPFEVGTSKVVPEHFSVKEGMGPGGINVLALKVNNQRIAYVTIDGNNMISGLREKMLQTLQRIGFDDGEVFTTDTHMVNGVVLTKRGYHPIGEMMDQEILMKYVKQAGLTALNDLEPAEVWWRTIVIPNVKIIGEKQIEVLTRITDETAKLSKRLAVSLLTIAGVIFTTLLILL